VHLSITLDNDQLNAQMDNALSWSLSKVICGYVYTFTG